MIAASTPSYEELAARFFRPRRHDLEVALSCVANVRDPHVAWEKLHARGLLLEQMLNTSERRFAVPRSYGRRRRVLAAFTSQEVERLPTSHDGRSRTWCLPLPPGAREAALVAADVVGMLRAESLAEECVRRWISWQRDVPESASSRARRICWRYATSPSSRCPEAPSGLLAALSAIYCHTTYVDASRSVLANTSYNWPWSRLYRAACAGWSRRASGASLRLGELDIPPDDGAPLGEHPTLGELPFAPGPRTRALFQLAFAARDAASRWRDLPPDTRICDLLRHNAGTSLPQETRSRTVGEMPNPFEPLLELLALGYVIADWSAEVIVLGAPPEPVA